MHYIERILVFTQVLNGERVTMRYNWYFQV